MPSQLTFSLTERFRKKCLTKNLVPYNVPGSFTAPSNIVRELIGTLREDSVIDQDDSLIRDDVFADRLYPLNAYGPDGGYNKTINAGGLANTKSNLGPYDVMDTSLPEQSLNGANWPSYAQVTAERNIPSLNKYSFDEVQLESINNLQFVPIYSFYANPQAVSFVPSTYNAYDILSSDNPSGSDGSLSQDSYIAQLGAKELQKILKKRQSDIAASTLNNQNNSQNSAVNAGATDIFRGNSNLANTTYKITDTTTPENLNGNFLSRLQGTYIPTSPIPGDYFNDEQYTRYTGVQGQVANALNVKSILGPINQLLGPKVIRTKSPSELFLKSTGSGQSSQLFRALNYNKYKPNYKRNIAQDFLQGALNVLGVSNDIDVPSNYYVGSSIQDPTFVSTPLGQVPVDSLGRDTQAPVIGPTEMSNLFENNSTNNLKFGLNGSSSTDGSGLSGGLVWVSPKYDNPGYRATVGGDQGPEFPSYNEIKSKVDTELSQDYTFREDSILDFTQKILDSTPRGSKRLSHVGNAINQLSKVFNDGYREITKGSQTVGYTNPSQGQHVGDNVYCRVFAKDNPYYTFQDLQKTDGNIRKFTYSVLDNTYNLNIAPYKNPGSTNIVDGKVKKYMFSIENLAWRTSNRAGLTYNDLPVCERGPNGGRIMWFPPYDISFNENVTPNFQENNFLGRPEPIYTYTNTKRSGQLSWKIIVDHPSILNLIVDKEMKNENSQRVNSLVDSFFAGCLKYDIYELARRWNTIPTSELFVLQQTITNPNIKPEDVSTMAQEVKSPDTEDVKVNPPIPLPDLKKYEGYGFYFHNDIPDPNSTSKTSTVQYETTYNNYLGLQPTYKDNSAGDWPKVQNFFKDVVQGNFDSINNGSDGLIKTIQDFFKDAQPLDNGSKPTVEISLLGSASAPATAGYNVNLSARRIDSVKKWFEKTGLGQFVKDKQLIITESAQGESTTVSPKTKDGKTVGSFNCTDNDTKTYTDPNGIKYNPIYSVNAMACRRVVIDKIKATAAEPKETKTVTTVPGSVTIIPPGVTGTTPVQGTVSTTQKIREGISKKILRSILTECDYFQLVNESDPMFYDSLKQKIKYFSPSFHSMTPEGLNSRLTFLQQCTRPGDTIPVIGPNGKPTYTNAVNTNFGAPPVLILRIGDFYHSKIIPTSLQISYDPLVWDFNPEGIGVQPMIAKVTLGFNIVGGQGLKEPIDKLQNALSFNFYGNTEMYDERADWTDDSFKAIDASLVKAILDKSPVVGPEDVKNNLENDGGDTIGVIQDKFVSDVPISGSTGTTAGTSGSTTYQKVMTSLVTEGQGYIDSVYGKTTQIVKDYNLPTATMYGSSRLYVDGKNREFTTPQDLKIYGKVDNFEKTISTLFDKVVSDIEKVDGKNQDGFFFIKLLYIKDFKNTTIKNVKKNLVTQVRNAQTNLQTSLGSITQELTNSQQNLNKVFRKLNIVDTKTDGYIKSDQTAKIYNLTPTNEVLAGSSYADTYVEFTEDYNSATTVLYSFYNMLKTEKFIDEKFDVDSIKLLKSDLTLRDDWRVNLVAGSEDCLKAEYRFYTAMCKIILNDNLYQTFKNSVITTDIANEKPGPQTLSQVFDDAFGSTGRQKYYKIEYDAEQTYVKDKLDGPYNSTYKTWLAPSFKDKVRKFNFNDYTEGTAEQKTRLQNIYRRDNSSNDNKTFNGKNKFN